MGSWVDDFSTFQNSTDGGGDLTAGLGIKGGSYLAKSPTRKEKLEAELKLLEWHRLANDAAIKVLYIY